MQVRSVSVYEMKFFFKIIFFLKKKSQIGLKSQFDSLRALMIVDMSRAM